MGKILHARTIIASSDRSQDRIHWPRDHTKRINAFAPSDRSFLPSDAVIALSGLPRDNRHENQIVALQRLASHGHSAGEVIANMTMTWL